MCVFLPAVAPFGFLRDFLPQVFLATAGMFPAGKEHTTVANGPCSATVIRPFLGFEEEVPTSSNRWDSDSRCA
jgi:hypothetical protein